MLSWEEDVQAHALREQGWSISAIARHLGVDRKTVRAYLSGEREPGRRERTQPTLIEPFLGYCRASEGGRMDGSLLRVRPIARATRWRPRRTG